MMPPRWLSWRHRQKASCVPVSQKARAMDIAAGTNLKNESEMKKYFFYLSTLALLAVACNKIDNNSTPIEEEPAPAVQMITETVSGSRGTSTKATIADADASFAWTAGDNVAVHISNGKYVYTSDSGASGATPKPAPDADVATFKVVYEAGYERDAFAVYPSTIVDKDADNYGQSGQALVVTLPSSYTLAQVEGEVSPCPMIATNAPGTGWDFYQLCGLLRLTVNSIPPSTKRLEISFDGKNVAGNFAIPSPVKGDGTSTIAMGNASGSNSSVITITNSGNTFYSGWGDGKVFNIPLPVGTYTNITVTAYNAISDGDIVLTMTRPFAYTASKEYGTKRTASFPVFSINSSRSKRVIFAPGNLQATTTDLGANWTWSFAEHQYDCLRNGGANTKITGNKTVSENGTIDLFSCSTTDYYYGITNSTNNESSDFTGAFVDWGTLEITYKGVTYPSGYWRTLTCNSDSNHELGYMMRDRLTGVTVNGIAHARFTQATINSDGTPVHGVIIFPDDFAGPTESTSDITWGNQINSFAGTNWGGTSCTSKGWQTLESAGCAFLPEAGYREGNTVNTGYSRYASSTLTIWEYSATKTFYLWRGFQFQTGGGTNTYWDKTASRRVAAAVRLAHEVQ